MENPAISLEVIAHLDAPQLAGGVLLNLLGISEGEIDHFGDPFWSRCRAPILPERHCNSKGRYNALMTILFLHGWRLSPDTIRQSLAPYDRSRPISGCRIWNGITRSCEMR